MTSEVIYQFILFMTNETIYRFTLYKSYCPGAVGDVYIKKVV